MGNTTSKEDRLLTAAIDGNVEEVKTLLTEGANLEWKDGVSENHFM